MDGWREIALDKVRFQVAHRECVWHWNANESITSYLISPPSRRTLTRILMTWIFSSSCKVSSVGIFDVRTQVY